MFYPYYWFDQQVQFVPNLLSHASNHDNWYQSRSDPRERLEVVDDSTFRDGICSQLMAVSKQMEEMNQTMREMQQKLVEGSATILQAQKVFTQRGNHSVTESTGLPIIKEVKDKEHQVFDKMPLKEFNRITPRAKMESPKSFDGQVFEEMFVKKISTGIENQVFEENEAQVLDEITVSEDGFRCNRGMFNQEVSELNEAKPTQNIPDAASQSLVVGNVETRLQIDEQNTKVRNCFTVDSDADIFCDKGSQFPEVSSIINLCVLSGEDSQLTRKAARKAPSEHVPEPSTNGESFPYVLYYEVFVAPLFDPGGNHNFQGKAISLDISSFECDLRKLDKWSFSSIENVKSILGVPNDVIFGSLSEDVEADVSYCVTLKLTSKYEGVWFDFGTICWMPSDFGDGTHCKKIKNGTTMKRDANANYTVHVFTCFENSVYSSTLTKGLCASPEGKKIVGIHEWFESNDHHHILNLIKERPNYELEKYIPELITAHFHHAYVKAEKIKIVVVRNYDLNVIFALRKCEYTVEAFEEGDNRNCLAIADYLRAFGTIFEPVSGLPSPYAYTEPSLQSIVRKS